MIFPARLAANARRVLRTRAAEDTFFVMLVQLSSRGVLFCSTLVMAQVLTSDSFAALNYFIITSALLGSYIVLGLPLATTKLVAAAGEDPHRRQDAMGAILVLSLGLIAVAMATAPLYLPLLASDDVALSGWWILTAALLGILAATGQAALYAIGAFRSSFFANLIGSGVFLLMLVVSALRADLQLFLIGSIAGSVTAIGASAMFMQRRHLLPRTLELDRALMRRVGSALLNALPGVGIGLLPATWTWLIARSLLEQQVSSAQFSTFTIGLQWFSLLMLVPLAASQVFLPRYVASESRGEFHLREILPPVGLATALIVFLGFPTILVAPLLDWAYGGGYDISSRLMLLIVATALVTAPQAILAMAVVAWRGAGIWLIANTLAFLTCIFLLAASPPRSSLEAFQILIATLAMLLSLAIGLLWFTARRARLRLEDDSASLSGG